MPHAQGGDTLEKETWGRLRKIRERRGVSPGFVAKQLGVDPSTLHRNEREGSGGLDRLAKYAETLNLRLVMLLPERRIIIQPGEVPIDQTLRMDLVTVQEY